MLEHYRNHPDEDLFDVWPRDAIEEFSVDGVSYSLPCKIPHRKKTYTIRMRYRAGWWADNICINGIWLKKEVFEYVKSEEHTDNGTIALIEVTLPEWKFYLDKLIEFTKHDTNSEDIY